MPSLLKPPLHVARAAAIAALRAVRLGAGAARSAGSMADEIAEVGLAILGAGSSNGVPPDVATAVADTTPQSPARDGYAAPDAPEARMGGERTRQQRPAPKTARSARRPPREQNPSGPRRQPTRDDAGAPTGRERDAHSPELGPAESQARLMPAPQQPPEQTALQPASVGGPVHIEAEETLVAAVADPGAEEGAGAQVHVDPPWQGYNKMRSRDIVERLAVESAAVLSVVELYERSHRGRRSVLEAAERELARRTSGVVQAS
jgi:hypothetical protein